jgi:hypothetical protein
MKFYSVIPIHSIPTHFFPFILIPFHSGYKFSARVFLFAKTSRSSCVGLLHGDALLTAGQAA